MNGKKIKNKAMIQKLILTGLVVLTTLTGFSQGVTFETSSMDSLLKKASATHKLIFVYASTAWCAPCKWMTANLFMEHEVGDFFSKNFIAVKIDTDRKEGKIIKEKYAVEGLPGYAFIDGNGNVIARASGKKEKLEFIGICEAAISGFNAPKGIAYYKLNYEQQKNEEPFMHQYIEQLHASKEPVYVDEFEQLLKITSIAQRSEEMVHLIYKHNKQIVCGGIAEKIIDTNFQSEAWKNAVKKEIRQLFQGYPNLKKMNTLNYAIHKKEKRIIDTMIKESPEKGLNLDFNECVSLYAIFFEKTGNTEELERMKKELEKL